MQLSKTKTFQFRLLSVFVYVVVLCLFLLFPRGVEAALPHQVEQITEACEQEFPESTPNRDNEVQACVSERVSGLNAALEFCRSGPPSGSTACIEAAYKDFGVTATPPVDFSRTRTCEADETEGEDDCIDAQSRCADGTPGVPLSIPDSEGRTCLPLNQKATVPLSENPIIIFASGILVFISTAIGIILVFITVIAGIRYIMARGNPQETAAAKSMIEKVAISGVLYAFAFVIINWLIPGGLLN